MNKAYRKQWLKWHGQYENKARVILQRSFKELALSIPYDNMNEDTYKTFTNFYITEDAILNTYVNLYTQIGGVHGKRVGKQINKQINQKDFTFDSFITEFQKTLVKWLVDNGGERIVSVRQNYIEYINNIIQNGIKEGRTISQIATNMKQRIKSRNFYRWQALRIARTETTTASNYAATVSSSVSGVYMDKVWVSAQDVRTRQEPHSHFDHYHMNGKKVALDKPFNVSGEKMMYAGDPKGSAGNIINCRCNIAQVVRRDKDGRIMRK